MMKQLATCMAAVGLTAVTPTASAVMISDVGDLDALVTHSDNPADFENSGYTTEADWVDSILGDFGVDYDGYMQLDESSNGSNWEQVEDGSGAIDGHYAFDLSGYTEDILYAVVKIGIGPDEYDHYLVENNDSADWLYLDIFDTDFAFETVGKISHVGFAYLIGGDGGGGCPIGADGCDPVPVPEPGALSLLGGGLLAMGLAARRRRRRD